MNILFISTMKGYSWGGSEDLWLKSALYSKSQGHNIYVVLFKNTPLSKKLLDLRENGIKIFLIEEPKPIFQPLVKKIWFKLISKIYTSPYIDRYSFINSLKPDIILLNLASAADITYYSDMNLFFKNITIPYLTLVQHHYENGILNQDQRKSLSTLFLNAKSNLFVSSRNSKVLERQLVIKIPGITIVKNPVNVNVENKLAWPVLSCPCFASVARLDIAYKGQDILLETISQFKWRNRRFILNMYGAGRDKELLLDLIKFYQLSDKIFLKGQINDIKEIWLNNHILLLPSLSEGTPLSLQEAMICGRPALVTDVGDNKVLIEDNVSGWVAASASANALDDALERCWNAQSVWNKMGNTAHIKMDTFLDRTPGKMVYEEIIK